MQRGSSFLLGWGQLIGCGAGLLAVATWLLGACHDGTRPWVAGDESPPLPPSALPAADAAVPIAHAPPAVADKGAPQTLIDVHLNVLHVQVPRAARAQAAAIWDYLREDALDSATLARLHRNGVRVGLGRTEQWGSVKAILDGVENSRVHELPPLRTLPGVPLALNLDRVPRDQTVFYVDLDGIISGDTWPGSQKALRVTHTLDTREPGQVFLSVVPEIRQQFAAGLSYSPESGWSSGPQRGGRAFAPAAFAVPVAASEFILLAPGEKADVFGMVGGVFLTDEVDGETYDAYVFLRAEVRHVPQHR